MRIISVLSNKNAKKKLNDASIFRCTAILIITTYQYMTHIIWLIFKSIHRIFKER